MEEMGEECKKKYLGLEMFVASFIIYIKAAYQALKYKYNFYSSHKTQKGDLKWKPHLPGIYIIFNFLINDIENVNQ